MTKREKMIARINELHAELIALGVEPEPERLGTMSDEKLIETGRAIAAQVQTRKRFLGLTE